MVVDDHPSTLPPFGLPDEISAIEPIDPTWARHLREEKEWLGQPQNLETYAGKVVALFNGKLWCDGPNQLSTLQAAKEKIRELAGEPGLPAPYELLYLVIPNWKAYNDQ